MEPTLNVGQRVLANRFLYHFTDPKIGDIVVFHPPTGADQGGVCGAEHDEQQACPMPTEGRSDENFIKRIVAGPGDTLAIRNGHPVVNGVIDDENFIKRIVAGPGDTLAIRNGHPVVNGVIDADEPYIRPCGGGGVCNLPKPIEIPPDHYFMMGDNRGESQDSRFWGPVDRDWIIGKAFATYWPLDRIGIL